MIFKTDAGTNDLNGFLDAGSHVDGQLRFENTFRIDGKLSGTIISDGTLVVGEGGHLDGDIQVGQIYISGKVEGKIHAQRRVRITPTGKVSASIETPSLVIEDGALFDGQCTMIRAAVGGGQELSAVPAAPSRPKAVQPLKRS